MGHCRLIRIGPLACRVTTLSNSRDDDKCHRRQRRSIRRQASSGRTPPRPDPPDRAIRFATLPVDRSASRAQARQATSKRPPSIPVVHRAGSAFAANPSHNINTIQTVRTNPMSSIRGRGRAICDEDALFTPPSLRISRRAPGLWRPLQWMNRRGLAASFSGIESALTPVPAGLRCVRVRGVARVAPSARSVTARGQACCRARRLGGGVGQFEAAQTGVWRSCRVFMTMR